MSRATAHIWFCFRFTAPPLYWMTVPLITAARRNATFLFQLDFRSWNHINVHIKVASPSTVEVVPVARNRYR
eukprot:FN607147.1.p2 GENE.FN607147.1~~FN607147.1.p2  ORF type:complete len:72 (-),score=16.28 FN607147.1:14-229(-)